jgi:glycosyltransferase involved in cell wall biosynthesis
MNIGMVAHFAYGAITGGEGGHVGGVERQTSLMCRWLAARGHKVSLLTWDEGQPDETVIDGVRVIKMCRENAGLPGLRFFTPRWTSLNKALKRADADVYYQNCAEYITGQVALWCRIRRRGFVYSVASDPDCDPKLPTLRTFRERLLYRYGLRHATRIIVQTGHQQRMLQNGFKLDSVVLPMPCPGPASIEYLPPREPTVQHCHVLWVGRIARVKRLELLLEVAQALPAVTFHVAGMPYAGDTYSESVLNQARAFPNVQVHGMVPREQMPGLYRSVSMLCCTSLYEGFPNTFLEAWSHGLPVVSTVDPDSLIVARGLGCAAVDTSSLVSAIRKLAESPALWRKQSANARQYYSDNHAVDTVMRRFEQNFIEISRGCRP